jgi:cell division protein FtsB
MRNYFRSGKIIFWIGLVLAIYMFVVLAVETSQNYSLRNKSDNLESQIAKLEQQIEDLGYKVTYYKTDSYRERLAREKLNVAAPGESVIIIKDDKRNEKSVKEDEASIKNLKTDEQALSEKPNYQQWWVFLFGN